MYQSGIKKTTAPQKTSAAIGGICRWWYVPVQHIIRWPRINLFTQMLEGEPMLAAGQRWIGPVIVPDAKLGWEESQEPGKPGHYYKQKLVGIIPGETVANRILLQNMPYNEYVVVARLRSSETYVLIGTQASGLMYDHGYKTGNGGNTGTAGSEFAFAGEGIIKAPVLPSFSIGNAALYTTIRFGYTPFDFMPPYQHIEQQASATFPTGSPIEVSFVGQTDPHWYFVAIRADQPALLFWFANILSFGSISTTGLWYRAGQVTTPVGLPWVVYRTRYATAFPSDILKFSF